jgi:hypothetical protein
MKDLNLTIPTKEIVVDVVKVLEYKKCQKNNTILANKQIILREQCF